MGILRGGCFIHHFPYLSALSGESLTPKPTQLLYLLAVAVVIILFIILLGVIMAKRKRKHGSLWRPEGVGCGKESKPEKKGKERKMKSKENTAYVNWPSYLLRIQHYSELKCCKHTRKKQQCLKETLSDPPDQLIFPIIGLSCFPVPDICSTSHNCNKILIHFVICHFPARI